MAAGGGACAYGIDDFCGSLSSAVFGLVVWGDPGKKAGGAGVKSSGRGGVRAEVPVIWSPERGLGSFLSVFPALTRRANSMASLRDSVWVLLKRGTRPLCGEVGEGTVRLRSGQAPPLRGPV